MSIGIGIAISLIALKASDAIQTLINAFKARVSGDGGTFEAEQYLLTQKILDINAASYVYVPSSYKTSKLYALKPTNGSGDLTFARNSVAYRNNASNVLEQMAANIGRIHYVNGVPTLLIEPARTNSVRNSILSGAVVGTPGTLPTNFSYSGSGLSTAVVGTGVENNLNYIDIRISGTATNTFGDIYFELANSISASNGQVWTNSCFIKIIDQTLPPITYNFAVREFNSSNAFLTIGVGPSIALSSTLNRYSFTRTNNQSTTAFIQPSLLFNFNSGSQYNFTIRIAAPQFEQGNLATSRVITSGSTATRVADTNSVARTFVQNQTLYQSIYLNSGSLTDSVTYTIADYRLNSTNRITVYRLNNNLCIDVINSTTQSSGNVWTFSTLTQNTIYKIAITCTASGFKVFVNGVLRFTSAVISMPNLGTATLSIGCDTTGANQYNGSLGENYIYNYTMTDSEAVTRTT